MIDRDKRHTCIFLLTLYMVFCLSTAYDPAKCIQCRKSHVCIPPECFCCRDEMPIKDQKIPQMVFFTFDDAVNPQVAAFYRELFDPSRLNPNGCPIKMTLFISHASTVYSLVREFFEKGMEIASHSVTHSNPNPKTFLHEAKKQKENLAKNANIPESEIKGWRSPFLKPLGDKQPSVLQKLGYEYDATLTIIKPNTNDKAPIPFTLDYGWPYDCKIQPCPVSEHKGFWEVPVVSVRDYLDKYNCVYIDGCNIPPPSEALAYKFLWDNFENYYKTNRAPMGINMHASWFYYPDRKNAMSRFIEDILKLGDVYIVTVSQVIAWLRDPTPLSGINEFGPWLCNNNNSAVPLKTVDLRPQTETNQRMPSYQIAHSGQQSMVTPRRPVVVRTRPTVVPTRPSVVYRQPIPTGQPAQSVVPSQFLQGLQNAFVNRPDQSHSRNGLVPAQVRQQMVHISPEIQERISHLLPTQVPLFPWTRQQFIQQEQPQPPLAANYPVVRFWWQPPERQLPHQPPGIHIVRPGQRTVSQQDMMQDNRRVYQAMQRQRQLAQQQATQRQQENLRQRNQEFRRLQTLHQQKELLQRQELERQRAEHLKRQEQMRRTQEQEMNRRLAEQQELERQRQLEMQRQRQLEMQRQNELEMARLREITMREEKQKQEELRQAAMAIEKRKQERLRQAAEAEQLQISQLFTRNRKRNKLHSSSNNQDRQKIKELKQLAEANFLKLQEMERHIIAPTTTVSPKITPKLGGKTMWQMDRSVLRQLKVPWQNWITDRLPLKHDSRPLTLPNMQLSEYNANSVVKVKTPTQESKKRVETLTSFKPQTVFSISNLQGSESVSINGDRKHSTKKSPEVIVKSLDPITTPNVQANDNSKTDISTVSSIQEEQTPQSFKLILPKPLPFVYTRNELLLPKLPKPSATAHVNTKNEIVTDLASVKETSTKSAIISRPDMVMQSVTKSVEVQPVETQHESSRQQNPGNDASFDTEIVHITVKPRSPQEISETPKQSYRKPQSRSENNNVIYLLGTCIQEENCQLPQCQCKQSSPPGRLLPNNTPQIVYITLDGSVDFHSYSNLKKIFLKERVNPNGCPIKGTIFATDSSSNYMIAKMLHSDGFEIAMKGMKSTAIKTSDTLKNDVHLQRMRLVKSANIPSADIKGWRSPDLKPLGDKQFEILRNNSLYDSTLIVSKDRKGGTELWPFTLDYGWREKCEIEECPIGSHPGVWEVPIIPVMEPNKTRSCEYADSCTNQPVGVEQTAKFLMDNFNQYYKSNRAPFAVRLQQIWFHWHYKDNLSGLNKFLDEILKLEDVYVVTVSEMLDWMKTPTPLNKIKSFQPWKC